MIKAIYERPTVYIILNGQKLKTFPLRSETRQGCPLSHTYSTQYWKSYPQQSDMKKKLKASKLERRKQNSLFADDRRVYTENPIDSTKNLLSNKRIGKTVGYKVNL